MVTYENIAEIKQRQTAIKLSLTKEIHAMESGLSDAVNYAGELFDEYERIKDMDPDLNVVIGLSLESKHGAIASAAIKVKDALLSIIKALYNVFATIVEYIGNILKKIFNFFFGIKADLEEDMEEYGIVAEALRNDKRECKINGLDYNIHLLADDEKELDKVPERIAKLIKYAHHLKPTGTGEFLDNLKDHIDTQVKNYEELNKFILGFIKDTKDSMSSDTLDLGKEIDSLKFEVSSITNAVVGNRNLLTDSTICVKLLNDSVTIVNFSKESKNNITGLEINRNFIKKSKHKTEAPEFDLIAPERQEHFTTILLDFTAEIPVYEKMSKRMIKGLDSTLEDYGNFVKKLEPGTTTNTKEVLKNLQRNLPSLVKLVGSACREIVSDVKTGRDVITHAGSYRLVKK